MNIRALLQSMLAALLVIPAAAPAQQKYPVKPVRVIVPAPAGGNIDEFARVLCAKLSEILGHQVVIDNRPGAGNTIGAAMAAKAAPDGYTLLVDNMTSHTFNPALYGKLPFDTERDFTAVRMLVTIPHILVTHPSLPARTMKELIAFAKAHPGQLNYASYGAGTTSHLAGELLRIMAHVDIVHVPYKGGPAALTDTIAGSVPMYFSGIAIAVAYVKNGRLRAPAVLTLARSPLLPEVPTMAEAANLPTFEVASRIAMMAPAGTAKEIVAQLGDAAARVLRDRDVSQKVAGGGFDMVGDGSADGFPAWFAAEREKWVKVIREAGIRMER